MVITTDGRTDGRTKERTKRLIEIRIEDASKKTYLHTVMDIDVFHPISMTEKQKLDRDQYAYLKVNP